MSTETKWQRISRRIEPLLRAGRMARAWRLIEDGVVAEPRESQEEELQFLYRIVWLAVSYEESALAHALIDLHASRCQALTPDVMETYTLLRTYVERSDKNHAAPEQLLTEIHWDRLHLWPWIVNLRLSFANHSRRTQEFLESLRRPLDAAGQPRGPVEPIDRAVRLTVVGDFLRRSPAPTKRAAAFFSAALRELARLEGLEPRLREIPLLAELGRSFYRQGRLDDAEAAYLKAIEAARELRLRRLEDFMKALLAALHLDRDEYEKAERLCRAVVRRAIRKAASSGFDRSTCIYALSSLGRVAVLRGNGAAATRCLRRAWCLAKKSKHPRHLGTLHLLRGQIYALEQDPVACRLALREYDRAESCFRSFLDQAPVALGRVQIARAEVYLACKKTAAAAERAASCGEILRGTKGHLLHAAFLLLQSQLLLARDHPGRASLYEEILGKLGCVQSPVKLFQIVSNLYLYSWDLGDQLDLTDYHLRQVNRLSEILDPCTFQRLYETHVTRRVAARTLSRIFGVDPRALEGPGR